MNYAMNTHTHIRMRLIVYSCRDVCVSVFVSYSLGVLFHYFTMYVKYVFIDDLSLEAFASRICCFFPHLSFNDKAARTLALTSVSPKAQKVFVPPLAGTAQFQRLNSHSHNCMNNTNSIQSISMNPSILNHLEGNRKFVFIVQRACK